MFDLTLIFMIVGLVAVGAGLVGGPVGYALGRRDERQSYESDCTGRDQFVMRRKRPRRADRILSAEVLTERECEFPSEIDG